MKPATRARLISGAGESLLRLVIATLRFRLEDPTGVLHPPPGPPRIWAFWHNRLFVMPYFFEHFMRGRRGAALTSASKDGEIVAAFLLRFGVEPVRGSSSRRGAIAWLELKRSLEAGFDIGITPDGPRGPRYKANPGVLLLAQKTGVPVLPVQVHYSRAWALGSWDGFLIPWPFSRVTITLEGPVVFPPTDSEPAFETERIRLEQLLLAGESVPL